VRITRMQFERRKDPKASGLTDYVHQGAGTGLSLRLQRQKRNRGKRSFTGKN
jgi:hypothetical protein